MRMYAKTRLSGKENDETMCHDVEFSILIFHLFLIMIINVDSEFSLCCQ